MIRFLAAAAAAVLSLSCAACGTTGVSTSSVKQAASVVVKNEASERAGVEQGFAATASGIAVAAQTGVIDASKLSTLRADLTAAYATLQIGRAVFAASGQAGSTALVAAQASADKAYTAADSALTAAGG